MIDLMHDLEKLVRVETVLLHQAAQRRTVAAVIVLLQPKRLVMGDLEAIADVIADANIDLLPQIEMMRIQGVVEIEDPSLDPLEILGCLEICGPAMRRFFRGRRLFLAIFVEEEVRSPPNHENKSKNEKYAAP